MGSNLEKIRMCRNLMPIACIHAGIRCPVLYVYCLTSYLDWRLLIGGAGDGLLFLLELPLPPLLLAQLVPVPPVSLPPPLLLSLQLRAAVLFP